MKSEHLFQDFFQAGPKLSNTYDQDLFFQSLLKSVLPKEVFDQVHRHLRHVGELAATVWLTWSADANANPPQHIPYDAWGKRIDEIVMNSGWKNLERAAATEGIVAVAYERNFGEWSRVYQIALMYLFHPSSSFVSCPLAMTDGAARTLELYGDEDLNQFIRPHLISRDPNFFWTAGQWMTEKIGGSDVSETSTVGHFLDKPYELELPILGNKTKILKFPIALNGVKWFTSATTSPMALALARINENGILPKGSTGLSLVCILLRDNLNRLNGIEIMRLKDKLGTRAMPTAELLLKDAVCIPVGDLGQGVRKIATVLNITRLINSVCAVAHLRRAVDLAKSYSKVRSAFGRPLDEHPLQQFTLKNLELSVQQNLKMVFRVAHLMGRDESGVATDQEKRLLRLLTPILKLTTAKATMAGVSECVESFGGAGYIEDTGIPVLLRDAQVFSIWEGASHVLSLDFLKTLQKENLGPDLIEYLERFTPDFKAKVSERSLQLLKNPEEISLNDETSVQDFLKLVSEVAFYLGQN